MIKWKFKNKHYYFDHWKALQMLGLLILIPVIAAWSEKLNIDYFSTTSFVCYALIGFIVYKACVQSYEPYYFDENGKKVMGEKLK